MEFGSQLRKIRKSKGLLQADLERIGGFDHSMISSYEIGLTKPSLNSIARLCTALSCTPNDLITEEYIDEIARGL